MSLKKNPIKNMFGFIIGYECPIKQIKIIECEKPMADSIIKKNHYSKKSTKNSCLNLLVYHFNKISGALQIGYGIRPKAKGKYNPKEVLEFDRMWLSDDMPKFSETITLSLLHHYLKKNYPQIKHLISYADTSVGNKGTIYKAANYKLIDKVKARFFILKNGERVHPITMWHRHGVTMTGSGNITEKVRNKLEPIYGKLEKAKGHQLKFVYDL
jgi:hypothetical protein